MPVLSRDRLCCEHSGLLGTGPVGWPRPSQAEPVLPLSLLPSLALGAPAATRRPHSEEGWVAAELQVCLATDGHALQLSGTQGRTLPLLQRTSEEKDFKLQ